MNRSGYPLPRRSAAVAARAQRRLVMPSCSVTSSKLPSPRLRSIYFRPPFCAYSKLSGMILVVVICHPHCYCHVLEGPIAQIAVEAVVTALATVRDVDVLPAIAIKVDNGDGGSQRSHLRHDVRELGIESGGAMRKINTSSFGDLLK